MGEEVAEELEGEPRSVLGWDLVVDSGLGCSRYTSKYQPKDVGPVGVRQDDRGPSETLVHLKTENKPHF